jgi:acid phosphatase (class A)
MTTALSYSGCDHGAMFFLRSPSMSLLSHPARPLLGLAVAVALAGCAATATKPTAVEANITTKAVGYLDKNAVPASLELVPAPPVAGSAALALDEQVSREARALRGSPRFAQAGVDAELGFPEGANHFSCAADIDVDAVKTPALYRLLERSRIDASAATKAAKNHYQRPRPFMVNGEPTCSPKDEEGLRENGSYPSGHTSIGWAWALILSEIAPDRADAIQARGRNAAFNKDLLAARREIAAARKAGLHSSRDCTTENAVLKVRPQSAL